jgi:hypothetical protein
MRKKNKQLQTLASTLSAILARPCKALQTKHKKHLKLNQSLSIASLTASLRAGTAEASECSFTHRPTANVTEQAFSPSLAALSQGARHTRESKYARTLGQRTA